MSARPWNFHWLVGKDVGQKEEALVPDALFLSAKYAEYSGDRRQTNAPLALRPFPAACDRRSPGFVCRLPAIDLQATQTQKALEQHPAGTVKIQVVPAN